MKVDSGKRFGVGAMVLMFAAVLLVSQNAFAQGTRGTVRGTVTDPNGAVVPNATVTLIEVSKTKGRTLQTNEQGAYQFIEVEPANYNLVISAPNFAEKTITGIRVEPNRNLILDAALAIGTVTDEVTVTAGEELVDRESATLGTTVENRRVVGLPLNGRNALNLALLQPGVLPAGGGFGSGSGIRVNGSRAVENNITLDGANNNEVAVGGTIGQTPRPDAIQEFRLLTSNFEAEFGRNTGSIINLVTKSGTNQFHGNGRFFYRPTKLSAARFLDKALSSGDPNEDLTRKFERKEYGGNIGGPIYFLNPGSGGPSIYDGADRSFFFVDFERRWQDIGNSQTISGLPTPAERNGDFSQTTRGGVPVIVRDPATGMQFPGNMIPANRFSPIAQYYLGFIPTGNANGEAQVSANQLTISNFLTMRFDHNVNQNHIINFTFNYFDDDDRDPFAFGGSTIPGFGASDLRKTRNHVGRYTAVIKPNVVNYLLINVSKNKQPGVAPVNRTTPAEIGFTANFVANPEFAGPPVVRLFDRGFQLGNTIQGPQKRVTENYQIQDSLSWVLGAHRLKFGVDATKYKQDTNFLFINQGLFTFSGRFGGNTTGDDFADLLIGTSPIAVQFGADGDRDYRQTAYAGFVQDTFRATNNLTLSFGMRYEYTSPLKDLNNQVAFYREGARSTLLANGSLQTVGGQTIVVQGGVPPRGLVYVGDPDPVLGGTVPRGGVALDKNNFAPRVGFAYSVGEMNGFLGKVFGSGQTVIRGAMGIYYGAVIGDTILQQLTAPGYNGTNFFQFPASGTLADPFAPDPWPTYNGDQGQVPNPFAFTTATIPFPLGQMSQPTDPNLKTPQVAQFNLTFERSFARNYVIGLSYVGNRGRKLYVREAINPAVGTFIPASTRPEPIPTPSINNSNSRRRNDDIRIALNQLTAGGSSNYDSLGVNFQKRFSDDGLSFQVAYTFSKSITDADTQRGQLDLLDRRAGRALSNDDRPHRFVTSFTYALPFFKNTQGFLNRLVDGWEINGIYQYQSGSLVTVGNPIDTTGTGGAILSFADLGAPFTALDGVANDRRGFNANAFQEFTCGTNFELCGGVGRRGTSGINQFRLDNPINEVDAVLVKKIRLFSETNDLELRFEAFNLFNTTQFTTINTNIQSSNFGKFTDQRESRIIQLGARFTF